MATKKKIEQLPNVLAKFLQDAKKHLEEHGLADLSISEIHFDTPAKPLKQAVADAADAPSAADKDPIICKNVKKGNKVVLECRPASKW